MPHYISIVIFLIWIPNDLFGQNFQIYMGSSGTYNFTNQKIRVTRRADNSGRINGLVGLKYNIDSINSVDVEFQHLFLDYFTKSESEELNKAGNVRWINTYIFNLKYARTTFDRRSNNRGIYINSHVGLTYRWGLGELVPYYFYFGQPKVTFNEYRDFGINLGTTINYQIINNAGAFASFSLCHYPLATENVTSTERGIVAPSSYRPNKTFILGSVGLALNF